MSGGIHDLDDGGHVQGWASIAALFLLSQVRRHGSLVPLLLTALSCPVPLLFTVTASVTVNITISSERSDCLALGLPSLAVAAAITAVTAVAAQLRVGAIAAALLPPFLPLPLCEEQLASGVALLTIEAFLDDTQMTDDLLDS